MSDEIAKLKERIKDLEKKLQHNDFYGLVWDKVTEPEKVISECLNKIPLLKRVPEKDIKGNDGIENLLIEGDNFYSLSAMLYCFNEKVDMIYIDPPYNTGNKDFKYNDNFVDKEDGYRHSSWLNMMEKRLVLAKKLLKRTGVIFISIDDNEMAQLKLLCDSIFGEDNFESFIWKKKGGAGNTEKIVGCLTEYILCYFKKKAKGILNYRELERKYKFKDKDGPYNLEGIEKTNSGTYERPTMLFPIIDPKTGTKFYPKEGMRWTIGKTSVEEAIKSNHIFFNYEKKRVYYIKRKEDYSASENVFYNLLTDCGSLATAKDELQQIFGDREIFDTPKPTTLMKALLRIASKPDSLILDFFAGTGTMGQAVLEMNKEDGGKRRFILCTNNESNICTDVTYPRIKKVISGYEMKGKTETILFEKNLTYGDLTINNEDLKEQIENIISKYENKYSTINKEIKNDTLYIKGINKINGKKEGTGGTLRYIKTDFAMRSVSRDQMYFNVTEKCLDSLCIKDDAYEEIEKTDAFAIYKTAKGDSATAVYFDFYADQTDKFVKALKKIKMNKKVYVFSLNDTVEPDLLNGVDDYSIEPIPQKLIEFYKKVILVCKGKK